MPFSEDIERKIYAMLKLYEVSTASPTELSLLTGCTAGTAKGGRALVLGATKNVDTLLFDVAAPAAAGSTITDAAAMTADYNFVTAANDAKGVKLPVAVVGRRIVVVNTVTNKILKVYPVTGSTINALAASAAYSIPAGASAVFYAATTSQWYGEATIVGLTATITEINKLASSGTKVASGTVATHLADLATTVAKTDIDDAGTIDGTEVAAALQAIHLKINAIILALEAFGMTALS